MISTTQATDLQRFDGRRVTSLSRADQRLASQLVQAGLLSYHYGTATLHVAAQERRDWMLL